jgi:hypothetical protein
MSDSFEQAWRMVKAHDRDALLPAERDLPGGDAFVGPHVSGHDIDYDYDVDENEDTGYDEHLDRNIAHQQDIERKKILADGVPHHQTEETGGLGDRPGDFEDREEVMPELPRRKPKNVFLR